MCYTHAQVPLQTKPDPSEDFHKKRISETKNKNYVSGIFSDPVELSLIEGLDDRWERLLVLNFTTDDILDCIQQLTRRNILRPQNLPAIRINFDSEHVITKKETILALENLLSINGMGIIRHNDQCLKLVPRADMNVDDLNKNTTQVTPKIYVPQKNAEQTLINGFLPPFPHLPQWSKFKYNSPEEKEYWDKLPDWRDKFEIYYNRTYKIKSIGEFPNYRPMKGFSGYVKSGDYCTRTILEYFRGYIVRSKSLFYNGQNQEQCNYKMGKLHGLSMKWYHNGQKQEEGNYEEGKKEGLWEKWYYDGQKKEESNYKEGMKDGLVSIWNYRGQKQEEYNYKKGKQDGLETWWYENGQKRFEENYKNGVKHGICMYWYRSGQKQLEKHWKDSLLMSARIWKPNGEVCPTADLKDGNGIIVWYNESGQKWKESNYQNGKHDGLETYWYENGEIKSKSNYKDGVRDGDYIKYDKSGSENSRRLYINGFIKSKN